MKLLFFTSVATNYLPKAAVLARSLKQWRPDALFYVVLCDVPPPDLDRFGSVFDRVLTLKELGLPVADLEQWLFKHTVVECCTAVKGPFIVQALEQLGAEKVVYFDPDVVVLDPLTELEALLDNHSVVVTPHLVDPESSHFAIVENEICSLKHGVFNLGFMALRNSAEGGRFARWWNDRLVQFCYDDIPNGLFTDQRWIDLAPAFFEDFHILRDRTYNVATWNLSNRRVEKREDGRLCINGAPLKFFHFSGFDSGDQLFMLQRYGQHSPALFELRDWYVRELEKAGQSTFAQRPWAYDCYSNGRPIPKSHRQAYRNQVELMERFPSPGRVDNGHWSYYRWCKKNIVNGYVRNGKMPVLKKWKRSINKRIRYLQEFLGSF